MMMRLFVVSWAISATILIAFVGSFAGPGIELAVAPIRTDQRMVDVVRDGQKLCWAWVSYKARPLISHNLDLFIDVPGLPGAVGAPYERDTKQPWVSSRAVPAGMVHHQNFCAELPPYAAPDMPVRIRQVAWYPGFLGLWQLPVHLPDVVDPPGAVIP